MSTEPIYIVDADVLLTAKNRYYAFDLCPGFWASIIHEHKSGRLRSIDSVRRELLNGRPDEDLVLWVKNKLPSGFFLDTSEPDVANAFGEVMLWATRSSQYYDSAKAAFATKADGWLVAYAMVHGVKVATNELSNPDSRREVKLGDACLKFGVKYEDTFEMLRALKLRYEFRG
ncbi:MAG: DUF4411 family protein [Proteobacteria bacterium]|nr:DUF4411 family protein [Pseudomonadota bacterium]